MTYGLRREIFIKTQSTSPVAEQKSAQLSFPFLCFGRHQPVFVLRGEMYKRYRLECVRCGMRLGGIEMAPSEYEALKEWFDARAEEARRFDQSEVDHG